MHSTLGYLFGGFAATWILLFGYIFFIQRLLGETRRRLTWLEEDRANPPAGPSERGVPPAPPA